MHKSRHSCRRFAMYLSPFFCTVCVSAPSALSFHPTPSLQDFLEKSKTTLKMQFKEAKWTGDIIALLWHDVKDLAKKTDTTVHHSPASLPGFDVTGERLKVKKFSHEFKGLEEEKRISFSERKVEYMFCTCFYTESTDFAVEILTLVFKIQTFRIDSRSEFETFYLNFRMSCDFLSNFTFSLVIFYQISPFL